MFEAHGLSISIRGTPIVSDVAVAARPGEITAIIGPNGSGKTTLLKAFSGDLAYHGEVKLNGRELKTLQPWQAASLRAVLPQASTLSFPFMVREVVGLGLVGGRSGLEGSAADTLPELALARVDLADFAGRFYQDLSGGEQQRVQLARVLCQVWLPVLDGAPRYLLLDEPIASLDIKHQLLVMRIARDFAAAGGGVIAVLHDLNLTSMFAQQILVMQHGRAAAFGTPDEILRDELMSAVFDCPLHFVRDGERLVLRLLDA